MHWAPGTGPLRETSFTPFFKSKCSFLSWRLLLHYVSSGLMCFHSPPYTRLRCWMIKTASHDQTPVFPAGCWGSDLKAEVSLPLNLTASINILVQSRRTRSQKGYEHRKRICSGSYWNNRNDHLGCVVHRLAQGNELDEAKFAAPGRDHTSKFLSGTRNVQDKCVQTWDGLELKRWDIAEGPLWCLQHAAKSNLSANANLLTHISDGQQRLPSHRSGGEMYNLQQRRAYLWRTRGKPSSLEVKVALKGSAQLTRLKPLLPISQHRAR